MGVIPQPISGCPPKMAGETGLIASLTTPFPSLWSLLGTVKWCFLPLYKTVFDTKVWTSLISVARKTRALSEKMAALAALTPDKAVPFVSMLEGTTPPSQRKPMGPL